MLSEKCTNKNITYVGWLGNQNLGDETIYQLDKVVFKDYNLISGTYIQSSRITLFGGGTLLPIYASLYVKPNRYNYAYGVGVDPSYWGKFDPIVTNRLKDFKFRVLSVRGLLSQKALKEWGIESEVVGDPCLLLEPTTYNKKNAKLIAVNFSASPHLWGYDPNNLINSITKLCINLKHAGYNIVLVPFSVDDLEIMRWVSNQVNAPIFEDWQNYQKLLDFYSSCFMVIGEKLHSVVFSAATYTPFICIEYQPKSQDFSETMGFDKYSIRTDQLNSKKLEILFNGLLNDWDQAHGRLIETVDFYRKRLRLTASIIIDDIEGLPDDKWVSPDVANNLIARATYRLNALLFFHFKPLWRAYAPFLFRL